MDLKGKRVILTGGCGFIGNTMTKFLLEEKIADLLVIDKITYVSDKSFHTKHDIHVMESDIASEDILEWVPKWKPDIIMNLAAESHVDRSIEDPNIFIKSNVLGTVNLMNAALQCSNLELFYHCSTDEIYGDIVSGWSKENDPRITSSPYSASKASAEMFVEAYGRTFGLSWLITRSSNNYGPFQHYEKFIPKAIKHLFTGKKVPIYGSGSQERDWIWVEDNCKSILKLINYADGSPHKIFNVGGDKTYTNLQIISKLCLIMDLDPNDVLEFVTDRPGHDKRYAIDTNLLTDVIGNIDLMPLDIGLMKTVNWYKTRLGI